MLRQVGIQGVKTIRGIANLRTLRGITPIGQSIFKRNNSTDITDIKEESDSNENDTSASTTGVIDKKQSEVLIYYDHLYGLKLPFGFGRAGFFRFPFTSNTAKSQTEEVKSILSPLPEEAKITECIPLKSDWGTFVKFCVPADMESIDFIQKINANLQANNEEKRKNIFRYGLGLFIDISPKIYTVKGTPWIEDLLRYPSSHLHVKYEGSSLTEEELYLLFRRYGSIKDIYAEQDSAKIIFRSMRSAIVAKQCVTGISLNKGNTVLHLKFIPVKRFKFLVDAIVNHQRITIPIILALLAGLAVFIFDPIREWCIELKITKKYELNTYLDNRYVQLLLLPYHTLASWFHEGYDYLDDQIVTRFSTECAAIIAEDELSSESINETMLWSERLEKSKQLKLFIRENINTFIIVKGPKGSGKEEFVLEHTLNSDDELKNLVLNVDCDKLVKSRTDNLLLDNTASELGYFPVFTWTNSISQFIDLGVQGLTGQKSGLSEGKETQIKNMFSLTTAAIRNIALASYKNYLNTVRKRNSRLERRGETLLDVLSEDEYVQQHPDAKPIIVISKFARKSHETNSKANDFMYEVIAEWTAGLIQNNLAHVIYTTSDVGSIQHLTEALPNQVFKNISLSDASIESSKQFLISQLKLKDSLFIDECFEPLGGRMLDLQAILRRIKSGETPQDALEEMITQSAEQVTTFFLNNGESTTEKNWNASQVWSLMKSLSKCESISYEDLVKSPLFGSSNEAAETLSTLEKYDLVTLKRENGVLDLVSTGRPIFKAAFKKLIGEEKIYKLYEVDYLNKLIKIESEKITKFENELINIYQVGDKLSNRIAYVSGKIEASNAKVVGYEKQIADINQVGGSKSWFKF